MKALRYPADRAAIDTLLDCAADEPVRLLLEDGTEGVVLSGEHYARLLDAELQSRQSSPGA